jgi:hypothetical protein
MGPGSTANDPSSSSRICRASRKVSAMPSASKVARSHSSNFFLCAAPILIAG